MSSHLFPAAPDQPAAADAIALATASSRVAPYRFIHKGLRALMFDTLTRAGALDATDPGERGQIVDEVERLLSTCADHLAHENRFFHDPLRQRAPRAVLPFHDDHLEHLHAIDGLRLRLQQLRDASGPAGAALAYDLFLRLSVFVGENLAHMAEEESTLTRALWAHFSDDEILALEGALQATLPPHEMAFYLHWMARGMNAAELAGLLAGARAQMPAPVVDALQAQVRDSLPEARWQQVAQRLATPA